MEIEFFVEKTMSSKNKCCSRAAAACEKWLTQLPKNDAVNSEWVCTAVLWRVQSDSDPDPPHARVESDTVLAPPENLEVPGQRTRRLSIGWPENDEKRFGN